MPASVLDPHRTVCVVLRGPLNAMGVDRERGEVVETKNWLNVQPLINTRRLDYLPFGVMPVTCECGRTWLDDAASQAHRCSARGVKSPRRERS